MSNGLGLNLFQLLPLVPPTVPTLPVSTLRKNKARTTCQPPRLPMLAERQLWAARRFPARAMCSAASSMRSMGTWDSRAARSKVNSLYRALSARSKSSKVSPSRC